MALTVTIVRHGNTFDPGEAPRRIGARTDLPLVATGRSQAEALAGRFMREEFTDAWTAPLARTRETMHLILAGISDPPRIEYRDWLAEIDHGPDENLRDSEVIGRIGEIALADWDSRAIPPHGWIVNESERLNGWRSLWGQDGNYLIVTSNGAARFALFSDTALKAEAERLASLKLRTGAYGRIVREKGSMRLACWDCRP